MGSGVEGERIPSLPSCVAQDRAGTPATHSYFAWSRILFLLIINLSFSILSFSGAVWKHEGVGTG